jgi:tetratricopeptide (TPR) repeat protein
MLAAGAVVAGRFVIERAAGAGGMGQVHRALDRQTERPVALKLLTPGSGDVTRFLREAEALAALDHPGIVRHVAHGRTQGGELYLAMDWLDGEDLGTRIARGAFAPAEAIALVAQIADALAAAHAGGLVHRDVKPSNLFLLGDRVILLDFGLVRSEDQPALTRSGTMLGTPGYMAPEQVRGAKNVDARADVFGLGCVLYACLAGRAPFEAAHPWASIAKVLYEDAPALEQVPGSLAALVARMLAKDPAARPADGREVARALADLSLSDAPGRTEVPRLGSAEQHFASVVVAGTADEATGPTLRTFPSVDAMRQVAAAYGASLDALGSSMVIAVITATGPTVDQAGQAARCALALRVLLPEVPMVVCTGRGLLRGRWPVGEVIDRAAALLPMTRMAGAGIRLDHVSAGLLDARFRLAPSGTAMELIEEAPPEVPARLLLGRPTRCVGRDMELRLLETLYESCVDARSARGGLIIAPPGVGKSRVRHELARRLEARPSPPVLLLARGDPMRTGAPFDLAGQLVRHAAGAREGEPLALRQAKLRARVHRVVRGAECERVTAFLCEIAGAPLRGTEPAALGIAREDPAVMRDQLHFAWEDWLSAECARSPVVLVLEDLHWGDQPSVKLIDAALRNLEGGALLVLALARPDVEQRFPGLWAGRDVQEIRLRELPARAAKELVGEVLGASATADVVDKLVEQASGNAFFLEELIRSHVEGRREPPASVLAVVATRLEAMEEQVRRLLRAAAVFGETFWRGGVAALVGESAELDGVLAVAAERELVTRRPVSKVARDSEYMFRHGLVRDAAYAMLTDADRVLGHRLAAEWLEHAGVVDPLTLAGHFERGGEPRRAARCYLRGAESLLEGNDLDGVTAAAERALACEPDDETRAALLLVLADASNWRGAREIAARFVLDALKLAVPGSEAWASMLRTPMPVIRAPLAELVATLDAWTGPWTPAHELAGAVLVNAATSQHLLEVADAALATLARRRGGSDAPYGLRTEAWLAYSRGWRHRLHGEMGAALAPLLRTAELFEAFADERLLASMRGNVACNLLNVGQLEEAERWLRTAMHTCDRLGVAAHSMNTRCNLGAVLYELGRLEEAERLEREAITLGTPIGGRSLLSARLNLAIVLIARGELAEADVMLELVQRDGDEELRAHAHAWRAVILLGRGDAASARDEAKLAMEELERSNSIEEGEEHLRLTYARALHAVGEPDRAKAELRVAREKLLARADLVADPRWRKTFLERISVHVALLRLGEDWGLGPAQ